MLAAWAIGAFFLLCGVGSWFLVGEVQQVQRNDEFVVSVMDRDSEKAKALVKEGVDVNHVYDGRVTAVDVAFEQRDWEMVGWLVERGAKLSSDQKDRYESALEFAARED